MRKVDAEARKIEKRVIQKLRDARQQQNISYEKLAEMSGLHRTAISLIERGERHPSLLVVIKLARCLDLQTNKLF